MSEHDERERFSLFRLCECPTCKGTGKPETYYEHLGATDKRNRCPECRGEGRIRQEVASAGSPEAVGVALVTLAREGEFEGCQFGLLDRMGEEGKRWLILPWPQTARTLSAAGRLLRSSQS